MVSLTGQYMKDTGPIWSQELGGRWYFSSHDLNTQSVMRGSLITSQGT